MLNFALLAGRPCLHLTLATLNKRQWVFCLKYRSACAEDSCISLMKGIMTLTNTRPHSLYLTYIFDKAMWRP